MTLDPDVAAFQRADDAFFTELVRRYSPLLMPHLRRYAHNDADAQDLLQDVWMRAYRKRATYVGRGSFIGWLLTVARTVGLDAVRRRHDVPDGTAQSLDTAYDPVAGDVLLRRQLTDAVLALPERQREVVLLRLVEGLSTAETAQRLGCAEGTVKASLHHATRKLQHTLKRQVS